MYSNRRDGDDIMKVLAGFHLSPEALLPIGIVAGILLGAVIGGLLGYATDNIGVGISIGAIIGLIAGIGAGEYFETHSE